MMMLTTITPATVLPRQRCQRCHRAGSLDFWLTGVSGEVPGPIADGQLGQAWSLPLGRAVASPEVGGKGHEVLQELRLVRGDGGEGTIDWVGSAEE